MISIHVQLLQGPASTPVGRPLTFAQAVVTFGRADQADIVVLEATASRQHGELRWDGQQWVVFNLSGNGTNVDGRAAGRKGTPLRGGEVISVGEAPLFRVRLGPAVTAIAAPAAVASPAPAGSSNAAAGEDANAPAAPPKSSKRVVLWTAIAIYMVFMAGVMVFLDTLVSAPESSGRSATPLTQEQIAHDIKRAVRVPGLDPGEARRQEDAASELFNKLDTSPRNLYDAYRAYRLALAYTGKDAFEPGETQLRFQTVESKLVEKVSDLYRKSYQQLRAGDFKSADRGFQQLTRDIYPATDSDTYRNAVRQRNIAQQKLKESRRKG